MATIDTLDWHDFNVELERLQRCAVRQDAVHMTRQPRPQREKNCGLIVMASHGRSGSGAMAFGSVNEGTDAYVHSDFSNLIEHRDQRPRGSELASARQADLRELMHWHG